VALTVQIHLQQNRADLALKEAQRARKWAQDSLLVNLAESWVGMREVRLSWPSLRSTTDSLLRAVRNISLRSTSSKSSHRHPNRNRHTLSSHKQSLSYTSAVYQKPKPRCNRQYNSMPRTQIRSRI
jgi:hypothetical protein